LRLRYKHEEENGTYGEEPRRAKVRKENSFYHVYQLVKCIVFLPKLNYNKISFIQLRNFISYDKIAALGLSINYLLTVKCYIPRSRNKLFDRLFQTIIFTNLISKMMEMDLITRNELQTKIYTLRGFHVMMDRDLAQLYNVETKVLNQAVKRNSERFPSDFRFQLNSEEFENWKSQFVTSNADKMGLRRPPYAFTEQGVAMLSAILKRIKAIRE
jgi:hypothetical protein